MTTLTQKLQPATGLQAFQPLIGGVGFSAQSQGISIANQRVVSLSSSGSSAPAETQTHVGGKSVYHFLHHWTGLRRIADAQDAYDQTNEAVSQAEYADALSEDGALNSDPLFDTWGDICVSGSEIMGAGSDLASLLSFVSEVGQGVALVGAFFSEGLTTPLIFALNRISSDLSLTSDATGLVADEAKEATSSYRAVKTGSGNVGDKNAILAAYEENHTDSLGKLFSTLIDLTGFLKLPRVFRPRKVELAVTKFAGLPKWLKKSEKFIQYATKPFGHFARKLQRWTLIGYQVTSGIKRLQGYYSDIANAYKKLKDFATQVRQIGPQLKLTAKSLIHNAAPFVRHFASKALGLVKDGFSQAKLTGLKAWHWAEDKTHTASHLLSGKAHAGGQWIKNKAAGVEHWAESKVHGSGRWLGSKAHAAAGLLNGEAQDAGHWMLQNRDKVGEELHQASALFAVLSAATGVAAAGLALTVWGAPVGGLLAASSIEFALAAAVARAWYSTSLAVGTIDGSVSSKRARDEAKGAALDLGIVAVSGGVGKVEDLAATARGIAEGKSAAPVAGQNAGAIQAGSGKALSAFQKIAAMLKRLENLPLRKLVKDLALAKRLKWLTTALKAVDFVNSVVGLVTAPLAAAANTVIAVGKYALDKGKAAAQTTQQWASQKVQQVSGLAQNVKSKSVSAIESVIGGLTHGRGFPLRLKALPGGPLRTDAEEQSARKQEQAVATAHLPGFGGLFPSVTRLVMMGLSHLIPHGASPPPATLGPKAPNAPSALGSQAISAPSPQTLGAQTRHAPAKSSLQHKAQFQTVAGEAARAGDPHPEITAAQWALESGWGKAPSGKNNLFGIKATGPTGTIVTTSEVIHGKPQRVQARFADYDTPEAGLAARIQLLKSSRYEKAGYGRAKTTGEALDALVKAGYATDPKYKQKLLPIIQQNWGGGVTGPAASPAQATQDAARPSTGGGFSPIVRPMALQRKGAGDHPDVNPAALRADLRKQSGGLTPDSTLRASLGGHLGFDPGGARLHTGPAAAQASRALNAEAFTIGSDVFFGEGRFDPHTPKGLGLIAHELTHVGQQTGTTGSKARFFTEHGGDEMEREAQQTGERVLANAGSRSGLFVEDYVREYEGEGGLTQADQQRLDRISVMALDEAQRMLARQGVHGGVSADVLDVSVEIDLGEMSDGEAARAWAEALVAALSGRAGASSERAALQRQLTFHSDWPTPTADTPQTISEQLKHTLATAFTKLEADAAEVRVLLDSLDNAPGLFAGAGLRVRYEAMRKAVQDQEGKALPYQEAATFPGEIQRLAETITFLKEEITQKLNPKNVLVADPARDAQDRFLADYYGDSTKYAQAKAALKVTNDVVVAGQWMAFREQYEGDKAKLKRVNEMLAKTKNLDAAVAQMNYFVKYWVSEETRKLAVVKLKAALGDVDEADRVMVFLLPYQAQGVEVRALAEKMLARSPQDLVRAGALVGYFLPHLPDPATTQVAEDILGKVGDVPVAAAHLRGLGPHLGQAGDLAALRTELDAEPGLFLTNAEAKIGFLAAHLPDHKRFADVGVLPLARTLLKSVGGEDAQALSTATAEMALQKKHGYDPELKKLMEGKGQGAHDALLQKSTAAADATFKNKENELEAALALIEKTVHGKKQLRDARHQHKTDSEPKLAAAQLVKGNALIKADLDALAAGQEVKDVIEAFIAQALPIAGLSQTRQLLTALAPIQEAADVRKVTDFMLHGVNAKLDAGAVERAALVGYANAMEAADVHWLMAQGDGAQVQRIETFLKKHSETPKRPSAF